MQSQLHYLPARAPGFFAILVAFFFIVLIARRLQSFMLSGMQLGQLGGANSSQLSAARREMAGDDRQHLLTTSPEAGAANKLQGRKTPFQPTTKDTTQWTYSWKPMRGTSDRRRPARSVIFTIKETN
jgi:hypothetical protein